MGATPYDRPEEIEYNPADGMVYIAETGDNKKPGADRYGRILLLDPRTNQVSLHLQGDPAGVVNPDNLLFDARGNMIIFEDRYDQFLAPTPGQFNNNVCVADPQGNVKRFATVPLGSEGTGGFLTPDGKTLFMAVQHPSAPWKSTVVAVRGF